jgi:sec-independent protein translocase protein TatA
MADHTSMRSGHVIHKIYSRVNPIAFPLRLYGPPKKETMETTGILLFIGGLGGTEVVLIVFAVVLLFGAKKIPELAKGLGRGIREFKDASKEIKQDFENSVKASPEPEIIKTDRELNP